MFLSNLMKEQGRPSLVIHARYDDKPSAARLWIFTQRSDATAFATKLPSNETEKFKSYIQELPEASDEPQIHLRGAIAQSFIHYVAEFSRNPIDFGVVEAYQMCFVWDPVSQAPGDAAICWYAPDDGFHIAIVHSRTQGRLIAKGFDWASDADKTKLSSRIGKWRMPPSSTPAHVIRGAAARLLGGTVLVQKTRAVMKRHAN